MINRASVFHRATTEFVYPIDDHTVHIKLRTQKGEVQSINIHYGDPFEWSCGQWVKQVASLSKVGTDSLFDYWLVAIQPIVKRLRYAFLLKSQTEEYLYSERGFGSLADLDPGHCFCYPYLHSSNLFSAPSWVKETIWYQIFPERFANGDQTNDPPSTLPWGSVPPTNDNFFGGDLAGVINHLDELVDLGINGIYFTPLFLAASNHKYDTIDYMLIDPQFGTKADLKRLVEKAHEKGIKIMLDAVFNHTGKGFSPFQDVLENGQHSPYHDWFHCHGFPLTGGETPNYETFSFYEHMPKLNTSSKEVRQFLIDIACYWIREFDIDGWRLDVANEIEHDFWREFRRAVKKIKPDVYLLGEVWHDAIDWLRGDQFDGVMNYPFMHYVISFFAKESCTAKEFIEGMTTIMERYPSTVNEALFNLVGSHDTARIMHECGNHTDKVMLVYTFLFTFTGTPCIYYGDEVGLAGGNDPSCRGCLPTSKETWNLRLREHVKQLISLRRHHPIIANDATFHFLEVQPDSTCVAYLRKNERNSIVVVLNPSNKEAIYHLPFDLKGITLVDVIKAEEFLSEANRLAVRLPPYGWTIIQLKDSARHL